MSKSKSKTRDEIELEKLVEIDGEYCVPHEMNEARHVVDWGPFEPPRSPWYLFRKFLPFVPAMYLFILAVQIMKTGAAAIGPDIQGQFPFANGISTLGFGWLGAYFVLSGSPVAATAISLFGAGTLTKLQTFTMLSGSRLGASFIVLLTGFLYAARNRHDPNRGEPIGMGIQAMIMTALVYLPGMMIGYGIIRSGLLDGLNLHASGSLEAALSVAWGPPVDAIENLVPAALLFLVGLLVILASFKVLDRVLPQVSSDTTATKRAAWMRRPWTMFALGCIVATLTLSVSVALTVLVPLAVKGYVRRDEALPYIMGANITTLADTLVVAMLQRDPAAAQIVLAEAIGVTIVSLAILAFWYQPVKRGVIRLDDYFVGSTRRMAIFVGILFVLPVSFLLSGLWIGPIVQ
jgi:solute carrier family 34 (sodium-dependent phosphate cotransporter)